MKIGIYAPKPNMGSSTLAGQLAYRAASRGRKVLLVELDYRYPSIASEWNMGDLNRCLERTMTDCKENPEWRLEDYLMPAGVDHEEKGSATREKRKIPKTLHLLVPSGLRGFEQVPEESEAFLTDLFPQAEQLGFNWVVLELSSEVDSVFTLSALQQVDVCVTMKDDLISHLQIFQQRMNLLQKIGVCLEEVPILYRSRSGKQRSSRDQEALWKRPVASFPFVPRGSRWISIFRLSVWRYRRALQTLFQSLVKVEECRQVGTDEKGGKRIESI